jgi:alpha-glucosidase
MSNNPNDSSGSSYHFVRVDGFTPNSRIGWTSFGDVVRIDFDAPTSTFLVTGKASAGNPPPQVKIYILGPSAFRVRFNRQGNYQFDTSFAVINMNLGTLQIQILQNDATKLSVNLGDIRLDVLTTPFTVQVYRQGVLISTDTDQGLEYIAGADPTRAAVANFKSIPAGARYFGFGEKGGNQINMINTSMTFFNYDNYRYCGPNQDQPPFGAVVPAFSWPGPLNYAEPLYNSIPLLIEDNPEPGSGSPYAYGLLFDNESQSYFNIGQSSSYAGNMYGKYYFGALYGDLDYYFMAGPDIPSVLDQFTTLTGRPSLPPMYVLGYHQGGYGYFSDNIVLAVAQSYRAANIPLDGIHIDVDFQNNYRTFTASPKKFPGGGKPMFDKLHQLGVKASTNITGIISIVENDETNTAAPYPVLEDGKARDVFFKDIRAEQNPPPPAPGRFVTNESYGTDRDGVNPFQPPGSDLGTYGYYADLGKDVNRQWWGTLYKPLLDAGLDMVWQDMTDPATQPSVSDSMPWKTLALNLMVWDETSQQAVPHACIHNVFSLNLVKATYDGLKALRPNQRPFIIARGGYAGIHRYAASWTGDSASDWDFLAILIPEILNFGLSGQPLAGADVGGFAASRFLPGGASRLDSVASPELLTRWTTLSAFLGWFRNHFDKYNKAFQEPYNYGNPVSDNCKKYIEIRYKLLQYFYDALVESTRTGLPICRPLFLTDRGDVHTYDITDQFMVGNDILVAPVIMPNTTSRNVYLSRGSSWYAYQDNRAPLIGPNKGGDTISWWVPLDVVPVYIRAGAIIPRRELEQYVGERSDKGLPCPLTFDVYPGPDSTHTVYLDDRISTDAQEKQVYRSTEISQSSSVPGQQQVRVRRTHDKFTPAEPFYFVALLQTQKPVSVTRDGAAIAMIDAGSDKASADALAASAVDAYYYNQSLQTTFVKLFDNESDTTLVANF